MIEIGTERIKAIGRQWLNGWLRMEEQVAPVTTDTVLANTINVYSKDKAGVSNLYFRDDAQVEHDIGGAVGTHPILGSTVHTDSTTGTVVRGDVITGQGGTPKWTRLAKGTANQVLAMDSVATDVVWKTLSPSNQVSLPPMWDIFHNSMSASGAGSAWSVLTNGDAAVPEVMFDSNGDVLMTETCGGAVCA